MSKVEAGKRVVTAVTTAFLQRRLHHQRMRIAALRALKSVSAVQGNRLQLDFDAGSGILERGRFENGQWMASQTIEMRWPKRSGTEQAARYPVTTPKE